MRQLGQSGLEMLEARAASAPVRVQPLFRRTKPKTKTPKNIIIHILSQVPSTRHSDFGLHPVRMLSY